MNGSTSPDLASTGPGLAIDRDGQKANGYHSAAPTGTVGDANVETSSGETLERKDHQPANGGLSQTRHESVAANGSHEDADSEAETLIDSPVKRREADRQTAAKLERQPMPRHRIGGLPVPTDGDDEDSAQPSPVPSTVMSVEKTGLHNDVKDEELMEMNGEKPTLSESLSSPRSSASIAPSRGSSLSRAVSELPGCSRNQADFPNPRKRKHRASSVSLPGQHPSIEPPSRKLRGLHSEDLSRTELSLSPKLRSHRRAVSTQSALADGVPEAQNRKRRSGTHGFSNELKPSKPSWEESDASSETTSHGNPEHRRPQRGVGRSTSTPGRPIGREHKRHINRYGFTKLAQACEEGRLDLVKMWRDRDPDQLELAEFAGNKPLQIAALNGNVEVVNYLIDQGCQIDCANVDKDTPLIDAAENGHLDVVHSLLRAGVDPLRQNLKGQQALDVVTDETDDADDIRTALRNAIEAWNTNGSRQRREEEEELRHRAGPTKELHFMARTYENLLKLVQINDRNGVKEFLDARVPVDNMIIAAAAKTGDSYLVNMLLAEMTEKKALQRPERPMLSVLGTSHLEMVKSLAELDNFNPLWRNKSGKSWPEIAEERHGPNWREEKQLLQKLYDQHAGSKVRRSSSPISKRDGGKRRPKRHTPAVDDDEENSDEDEAPRRKNGRRLMSKRDMRVASGRAPSEESSIDFSSEGTGDETEVGMKPPTSPAKQAPTQVRPKSVSTQLAVSPGTGSSPPLSRRSSSTRAVAEPPLPTVDEMSEVNATLAPTGSGTVAANEKDSLEIKIKREREAEAEAEAVAAAAAAAAAQRAELEKARQAEEQRRAERLRREAELREEEAQRKAAEERARMEREFAAAKLRTRERVAHALPLALSHVLNPASTFNFADDAALDYLIQYFTPLQVLKHEHQDSYATSPTGADVPYWVSNVQAAPLVGKRGIELMLPKDSPGFQGSLADIWNTKDVDTNDYHLIGSVLASLPQHLPGQVPLNDDLHDSLSFEEDVQRAADRVKAVAEMKARLYEGEAVLRYVRLDELWKNLHLKVRDVPVEVRFDYMLAPRTSIFRTDSGNFVTKLSASVDARPRSQTFVGGEAVGCDSRQPIGRTQVSITASL